MPSNFDNTYHYHFSKPSFDREQDRAEAEMKRVSDTIFEVRPPREPT